MRDQIPPQDLQAEQAALGSILIDPTQFEAVAETLKPADFYRVEHGSIFAAMTALVNKREPIDLLTLQSELQARGEWDNLPNARYLIALMDATATSAHAKAYAELVKAASVRRRLIFASGIIRSMAQDENGDIQEIVNESERALTDATTAYSAVQSVGTDPLMPITFDYLEALSENPQRITGIPTGINDLDYILRGFQPSTLVVIAAPTGGGKSALASQFAVSAARHFRSTGEHKSVFFASLEMSNQQTAMRMLAAEARVDGHLMRTGNISSDDFARIGNKVREISDLNIHFCDDPYLTLAALRLQCRRRARTGLGLLVVDYVQMLDAETTVENRARELDVVARGLKAIAKEHGICVIALSQLNRAAEARADKRPMLSDLRDSSGIAANADVVMFPYNPAFYGPQDERQDVEPVKIIVAKHRDGMTGDARALWFRKWTHFGNPAREE